jgi:hypothetical protein
MPSPSLPHLPCFQAESALPLSLILLKRKYNNNKKDKTVLLVKIRIAIQSTSFFFILTAPIPGIFSAGYHFSIFLHKHVILPSYSYFYPNILPTPTGIKPQIGPVLFFCSPFWKKDIFVCIR